MSGNNIAPMYQKIALDIANGIYKGQYVEEEKLHGRSTLAGIYNVSPETIRRAIKLLEDVGVVESVRGSGIIVISRDKAFNYINKFKNIESISSYKATLDTLFTNKRKLDNQIVKTIDKIVERTSRLSNITSITPFEIEITQTSKLIGKSIGEVRFWQYTGATIIGIRRDDDIILSPGPYANFQVGDVLLVIGEDNVYDAVRIFLDEE